MTEVPLIERGTRTDGHQNIEINDSNSDHSDVDMGKGTSTLGGSAHPSMKNGLLIRRPSGQSETILNKPGDVELDWTTGMSTATESGSEQPDLRLRKNTGSEVPFFQCFDLNGIFILLYSQYNLPSIRLFHPPRSRALEPLRPPNLTYF